MPARMLSLFALGCLTHTAVGASPSFPPKWPASFAAKIFEIRTEPGKQNTTGYWAFDAAQHAVRVDRDDGEWDQLCGTAKEGVVAKCTVLATQGVRYLFWPGLGECCLCCRDENGCGAESEGWLDKADYKGTEKYAGVMADKFEIMGFAPNYWWQDVTTGRPVALLQKDPLTRNGQDIDVFDSTSLSLDPVDPSVFAIPPYCPAPNAASPPLCGGHCINLRMD